MTKVKPTTKEQLVYYLLHNISLGTYDRRFLNNLQSNQLDNKNPVTSNQAELLNKITLRYSKQLRRKEIDANEMVNLAWVTDPIESLSEYTDAFITIKDSVIELRTPYKKDFISDMRNKTDHLNIVWHKETKVWTAPLCEDVLKHFIKCVEKHYHMIHYCPQTVSIINNLAEYETAKYWDPTLVRINGNLYIVASNKSLDEALGDIKLDLSLPTLARLVCYGIKISDEVILELIGQDIPHSLIDFTTSLAPILDVSDPTILVEYLKQIECDFVLITESFGSLNKNIPKLIECLKLNDITLVHLDKRSMVESINFTPYTMPVMINSGLWATPTQNKLRFGAGKTVFLGNNNPIEIK